MTGVSGGNERLTGFRPAWSWLPFLGSYPILRAALLALRPRVTVVALKFTGIPEGKVLKSNFGNIVRMHCDKMYAQLSLFGEYEPIQTRVYRALVSPGDVVLDVGANFGWFTVLFANWTRPGGMVHAFEPVPQIFEYTKESIMLNGLSSGVVAKNLALGERDGELTVFTFGGLPHGHASASSLGRTDAVPNRCALRKLDTYAAENGLSRLDFVKVDVEGYEGEVFRGGAETLSRYHPIIAFEVNPSCLSHRRVTAASIWGDLREFGYYSLWRIARNGALVEEHTPLESENADYIAADPGSREVIVSRLKHYWRHIPAGR